MSVHLFHLPWILRASPLSLWESPIVSCHFVRSPKTAFLILPRPRTTKQIFDSNRVWWSRWLKKWETWLLANSSRSTFVKLGCSIVLPNVAAQRVKSSRAIFPLPKTNLLIWECPDLRKEWFEWGRDKTNRNQTLNVDQILDEKMNSGVRVHFSSVLKFHVKRSS